MTGVRRIGCVNSDDQHRPRLVRSVCGAPMYGQRRARRNVTTLWHLLHRSRDVAIPQAAVGEHVVLGVGNVVPLRAEGDLEGTMFGPRVDRAQVEREAVQATPFDSRFRSLEVAVPRLVGRTREGDIEPDLDDAIIL